MYFRPAVTLAGIIKKRGHAAVGTEHLDVGISAATDFCHTRRCNIFTQKTDGITRADFQCCRRFRHDIKGAKLNRFLHPERQVRILFTICRHIFRQQSDPEFFVF